MIKRIIITSPSLDTNKNVGGISTVTNFIIDNNKNFNYKHFELGKHDEEKRGILWFLHIIGTWSYWFFLMIFRRDLLIHFNFALEKPSIIRDAPLILFAHLLNKRMVIHLHGGKYLAKEDVPGWIQAVLRSILSGKEPKIVLSPLEKELIVKKFRANNIMVLPNSIDIKEAKKFNRIYPAESPVKLLFIGRIVKSKGIEYIYQAIKILKNRDIQFKFIMAGNGPEKNEYVQKFVAILGSDFDFKGIVSGETKTDLFKNSDIFLLPSLYGEGLPISLLESMSFEIVPIVTDDGSMKYIIQNGINGIIVEKGSSDKIAEAVEKIMINQDLMKEIGMNARQYVFENHDPIGYIKLLNEVYDIALKP